VKQGKDISLDASKSYDPDDDQIRFKWWLIPEAGTSQEVIIPNNNSSKVKIKIPPGSVGEKFHVICEVTDNGEPNLTGYRRFIVNSKE
jgi:hypothetical protein